MTNETKHLTELQRRQEIVIQKLQAITDEMFRSEYINHNPYHVDRWDLEDCLRILKGEG